MAGARGFSLLERFELKYHIPVEWADLIGQIISPYCEEDYYSENACSDDDGFKPF